MLANARYPTRKLFVLQCVSFGLTLVVLSILYVYEKCVKRSLINLAYNTKIYYHIKRESVHFVCAPDPLRLRKESCTRLLASPINVHTTPGFIHPNPIKAAATSPVGSDTDATTKRTQPSKSAGSITTTNLARLSTSMESTSLPICPRM
jgi:hypothetical protein